MIISNRISPILIVCAALAFTGCWYSFSEKAYPQIKTIGVIPFENETAEYELASQATDLLTQKLLSSSSYRLSAATEADGVISGRITIYERKVNTYDQSENPIDYIVRIRARVTFAERAASKTLWESDFEGIATFATDDDEAQARQNATELLVQRIYDKIKRG